MNPIIRTVVLLLLLTIFFGESQAKPTVKEYLRRGDTQLEKNNLPGAIRNYSKAIELDPTIAEAYIRRGMARRAERNLDGAIDDFETALQIDEGAIAGNQYVAESYSNRGYIEMGDFEIERAIADFTKAIRLHGDARDYFRRGQR